MRFFGYSLRFLEMGFRGNRLYLDYLDYLAVVNCKW